MRLWAKGTTQCLSHRPQGLASSPWAIVGHLHGRLDIPEPFLRLAPLSGMGVLYWTIRSMNISRAHGKFARSHWYPYRVLWPPGKLTTFADLDILIVRSSNHRYR